MTEAVFRRPPGGTGEADRSESGAAGRWGMPTPPDAHRLGRRNDRILVLAIVAYVAILAVLMIVKGDSITPDVAIVGSGLGAAGLVVALGGRARSVVRDWLPFAGLFLAYELMRGYADDLGPNVHVADVAAIDRWVGIGRLPTEALQHALHPVAGPDLVALGATLLYILHFPLPLAVGALLWRTRRRAFYDFVAALVVLSIAAFVTYLVMPVAPPWLAAAHGALGGPPAGPPPVLHLKDDVLAAAGRVVGFGGGSTVLPILAGINPNEVAAFPSLHAAYPFLAFLFVRRWFGARSVIVLAYAVAVWFAVVYLGEHYVIDVTAGVAYAGLTYWAVFHAPVRLRRLVDRPRDESPNLPGVASA